MLKAYSYYKYGVLLINQFKNLTQLKYCLYLSTECLVILSVFSTVVFVWLRREEIWYVRDIVLHLKVFQYILGHFHHNMIRNTSCLVYHS